MSMDTKNSHVLQARLEDAVKKSERGECGVLPFLTPLEKKLAQKWLVFSGYAQRAYFFGGYDEAERMCLFLLPEYLLACLSSPVDRCQGDELNDLLGETLSDAVCALRIEGSTYHTLTHRDYMGAILGLGLERDALGDIALQNEHTAVVFCSRTIARFLTETLTKVGADTVKCRLWELDESFTDGRRYQRISDTIASARLDCVVAALTNLSREGAQELIKKSFVEVDYECVERVGESLEPPVLLTVRGHGKFRLLPFGGETKKGRLRMQAEKFI